MFSDHPRAARWSFKNNVDVNTVTMNCHTKFLFDCVDCGHEITQSPNSIVSLDRWCPYCEHQKLCDEDCDFCFDNSFASNKYANQWIYELNDKTPREVLSGTSKKYWLKCDTCKHEYEKSLKRIKEKNGCYFCNSTYLCEDEDCDFCFNKSLASDPRAEHFISSESGKTTRQIVKKGKEMCTFECQTCKHLFTIKVGNFIQLDQSCGFCTGRRWCEEECAKCYAVSFASHEKALQIVDKDIDLSRVRRSSKDKYEFECEVCKFHFEKAVSDVTRNSWCPKCVNKTEKKLFDILNKLFDDVIFQKHFDWCIGLKGRAYPFDFFIPSKGIIIELDGEQHFKDIKNWLPYVEQQKRDIFKMNKANKKEYSVIRLFQPDVLADKNNWKKLMLTAIKDIEGFDEITNIFIGKGNLYNKHIEGVEKSKLAQNIKRE